MVIYTVASGKGGVGKTIYTINTAIAMADLNLNILVVDNDIAMADIGAVIDVNLNKNASLHDVLAGDVEPLDAIIKTPYGFDMLPCGTSIKGFKNTNPDNLKSIMDNISKKYDAVFIDAPAGISKEGIMSLVIANEVILITTPELPSIANIIKTKIMADAAHTKIKGIVINKVMNIKGEISTQKVEKMINAEVIGTIPYDVNVIKSVLHRSPIIRKAPNSSASNSIKKIAMNIANIPEKEDVNNGGFFDKIKSIFNK